MVGRLGLASALAIGGWVGALVGFAVYVNWFSETDRAGDWVVLGLAWFSVLVALAATFAALAIAALAIADRWGGHA